MRTKNSSIMAQFTRRIIFGLTASITALSFTATAVAFTGSGAGSIGDPFQITDCDELQEMRDALSSHYVLMNDIDCSGTTSWNSGAGFIPVGTSGSGFSGSLDGQNYTISSLFINRGSTDDIGLFGFINGAELSNIHLTSVNITGKYQVAALVGQDGSASTVTNCSSSGTVSAQGNGAGIGGYLSGTTLSKVRSSVNVTATASNFGFAGLISSLISGGSVSDCYASGTISAGSSYYVGGLLGDLRDSSGSAASRCYSTGAVTSSSYSVGGLVGSEGNSMGGSNLVVIQHSYARGSVSGGSDEGGLVGNRRSGSVVSSYFDETGTTQSSCVGTGGVGSGGSCTAVNTSGSPDSTYFLGNSTNGPFPNWDFVDIWQICTGSDPKFQGECSAAVSSASVTPASLIISAVGNVGVTFTPTNAIADDGKILITFPAGFVINSGGTTAVSGLSNIDGAFSASASGQVLTLTRSGGSNVSGGTSVSFTLSNIKNPTSTGVTGTFTIRTANSSSAVLDQNTAVSAVTITDCASGTYGSSCTACPGGSSNVCSGNGTCDDGSAGSGVCSCAANFVGAACDDCEDGYYGNACSQCPGAGTCSGNGTCSDGLSGTGVCTCDTGFTGNDCGTQISLVQPKIKVQLTENNKAKLTCLVNGNSEGITPSSYRFHIQKPPSSNIKIITAASAIKNISVKSGVKYSVRCSYIASGVISALSKKKQILP